MKNDNGMKQDSGMKQDTGMEQGTGMKQDSGTEQGTGMDQGVGIKQGVDTMPSVGTKQWVGTKNKENGETLTKWFWWSNWAPEKMEAWVEAKAAAGWTLVKVDRGLVRFRFVRTVPHQVRVCADFPADPNDEYMTIFKDAGWQLVGGGLGWHVWQMEYSGTARPEAFTDLDPLIERNARAAVVLAIGMIGPLVALGLWGSRGLFHSVAGRVLMVIAFALAILLAMAVGATLRTITKLKERKDLTSG